MIGDNVIELNEPLSWRKCPSCKCSLVDAEISETLQHTCESGAFHSKLIGKRNEETWQIQDWKCPDCETIFT